MVLRNLRSIHPGLAQKAILTTDETLIRNQYLSVNPAPSIDLISVISGNQW
jgi:hypothetical protein